MTGWLIFGSLFAAGGATAVVLFYITGLTLLFNAAMAVLDNGVVVVGCFVVLIVLAKLAPKVTASFGNWNVERLPYRF